MRKQKKNLAVSRLSVLHLLKCMLLGDETTAHARTKLTLDLNAAKFPCFAKTRNASHARSLKLQCFAKTSNNKVARSNFWAGSKRCEVSYLEFCENKK